VNFFYKFVIIISLFLLHMIHKTTHR